MKLYYKDLKSGSWWVQFFFFFWVAFPGWKKQVKLSSSPHWKIRILNTDVKSWVWEEFSSRLEAAEVRIFRSLLGYKFRFLLGNNNKKRKIDYVIGKKKHLEKILQKFCKENREWYLAKYYVGLEYPYQIRYTACHGRRGKLEKEVK